MCRATGGPAAPTGHDCGRRSSRISSRSKARGDSAAPGRRASRRARRVHDALPEADAHEGPADYPRAPRYQSPKGPEPLPPGAEVRPEERGPWTMNDALPGDAGASAGAGRAPGGRRRGSSEPGARDPGRRCAPPSTRRPVPARAGARRRLAPARSPSCQAVLQDSTTSPAGRSIERSRRRASRPGLPRLVSSPTERAWPTAGRTPAAFTVPGSRVVHVCRPPAPPVQRDSASRAILIHEMLHTLGLRENPPTAGRSAHGWRALPRGPVANGPPVLPPPVLLDLEWPRR